MLWLASRGQMQQRRRTVIRSLSLFYVYSNMHLRICICICIYIYICIFIYYNQNKYNTNMYIYILHRGKRALDSMGLNDTADNICCLTQQTMAAVSHSRHCLLYDTAAIVCCFTQQTFSAVRHRYYLPWPKKESICCTQIC